MDSGEPLDPAYTSRAYTNAQVYALAEKYDIAGLKVLANKKFHATMVADFHKFIAANPELMIEAVNSRFGQQLQ